MKGLRYDKKLSNDEIAVYVGPKRVMIGLRGTKTLDDLKADGSLFLDATVGKKTIKILQDIAPRKEEGENKKITKSGEDIFNNRVTDVEDVIKTIKDALPNKKIVLAAHSLGGSILKGVMDRFEGDTSLSGHTFNSWLGKDDERITRRQTFFDIVATVTAALNVFQQGMKARSKALFGDERDKQFDLGLDKIDVEATEAASRLIGKSLVGSHFFKKATELAGGNVIKEGVKSGAALENMLFGGRVKGVEDFMDAARYLWQTNHETKDAALELLLGDYNILNEPTDEKLLNNWINLYGRDSLDATAEYTHNLIKKSTPQLLNKGGATITPYDIKTKWLVDQWDDIKARTIMNELDPSVLATLNEYFKEDRAKFFGAYDARTVRGMPSIKDWINQRKKDYPEELSRWYEFGDLQKYLWEKPHPTIVNMMKDIEKKQWIKNLALKGLNIYSSIATIMTIKDIFQLLHSSDNFKMDEKYEKILKPTRKSDLKKKKKTTREMGGY